MADPLPPIDLGLDDNGHPVVLVGDEEDDTAADPARLLQLVPALAGPPNAPELARALNHLAHGGDYRVITDPAEYEAGYRARLAKEDPAAPWLEGVVRLRDFGEPDFSQIHPPASTDDGILFFVADAYLGVPFKATAPSAAVIPSYDPLPLTPVAIGPAPPEPDKRHFRRLAAPEDQGASVIRGKAGTDFLSDDGSLDDE